MTFHLHEDDWGMIALEPEENRFERTRVVEEARAFGEAHKVPDGIGWTAMAIVPASPIELTERGLSLEALRALLGPEARELSPVTTGYSSHVEPVADGFAFTFSTEPHENRLYGRVSATGIVTQLNLAFGTPAIAEHLHRLGTELRLILVDLWQSSVTDLASRGAIDAYLAADDT